MAAGVEAETAEDGISHIRGTTDQDQATKDRKTNFVTKFKFCTNNYTCNFSPYRAQSEHAREMVALNKEGYNNPTTCRTHQGFHRELVSGNTRPLGPLGGSRLSATSGGSPNSDPNPSRVKVPNGSDRIDHCRGTRTLRQTCHQFSSGRRRGFHIPNIHCPQKRRRIPSSNKPEGIEQLHSRGTLQDGRVSYGKGNDQTTRLVSEDLSKGCISISPNTLEPPQIPPVSLAIPEISVQLSAFRTVMCTSGVYKTNETSSGLPEGERNEIDNLPGQHTGDVGVSGGVNKTSESDPRSVLCAGYDNQQQEVTVVTSAGFSISGAPDINSTNENSSPKGEDLENLWRSNSSCTKIDGNNSGAGCICGNDQCNKASDPYSSLVSPSHIGPDKQGGSSSRAERGETTMPKNGSPHTGSPGRTSVVGQNC